MSLSFAWQPREPFAETETFLRLWPVSREALPKPFIKLADGQSLLAKALRSVLTVTNRDYFFLTRDEYELASKGAKTDFLLEPVSRNTGPAICAGIGRGARSPCSKRVRASRSSASW